MNRESRNMSLSNLLAVLILLCSIVCSSTNFFGTVSQVQTVKVIKKPGTSAQKETQMAEKAESESDDKHHTALFVIHTLLQSTRFDLAAPHYLKLANAARFGGFLHHIPIYLVERTIRI